MVNAQKITNQSTNYKSDWLVYKELELLSDHNIIRRSEVKRLMKEHLKEGDLTPLEAAALICQEQISSTRYKYSLLDTMLTRFEAMATEEDEILFLDRIRDKSFREREEQK